MCSGAFPVLGGLPGVRQASIAASGRPTGSQGARGNAGAVCRIAAVQRRADVREGLAQLQSLDEKRRDGATFGQGWEAVLTPSRPKPLLQIPLTLVGAGLPAIGPPRQKVVPRGCTFLLCNGAKVLPRSTFGAFVSGYFRNPVFPVGFDGLSVRSWPNALQAASFTACQVYLTNAFSTWPAYCRLETADCSDA